MLIYNKKINGLSNPTHLDLKQSQNQLQKI